MNKTAKRRFRSVRSKSNVPPLTTIAIRTTFNWLYNALLTCSMRCRTTMRTSRATGSQKIPMNINFRSKYLLFLLPIARVSRRATITTASSSAKTTRQTSRVKFFYIQTHSFSHYVYASYIYILIYILVNIRPHTSSYSLTTPCADQIRSAALHLLPYRENYLYIIQSPRSPISQPFVYTSMSFI